MNVELRSIDNKGDNTLVNLLKKEVKSGSKIAIASAYFSIFAYDALRTQLEKAENFKFLYTKPTFYKKEKDIKRQYSIQAHNDVNFPSYDGNPFEIKLRNKMMSTSIANNVSNWIKEKAEFKTLLDNDHFNKGLFVQDFHKNNLMMLSEFEFTADGIGVTPSNRLSSDLAILGDHSNFDTAMQEFNRVWNDSSKVKDVTQEVLEQMSLIYKENSPEWIYFVTLYNIFFDELESISEDNIIKEGTNFKDTVIWNKLYPFQRDGVVGMLHKIEEHNGCILADSVGLGKTFSALAVIKYYELRNDRVLVLCPKKLRDNWTVYTQNDKRNLLSQDRFNYDVLNHTDLSREDGYSAEINLATINWSNYDLVVIDESHNFKNNDARKNHLTRYQKLMQEIIKKGVKTKVLMLSATPVNNKMNDIKNQIAFITEDNDQALETNGIESIDNSLRLAQTSFNRWTELPAKERTTNQFLDMVNPEYFQLLDLLTIARSRKHIEKYYNIEDVGEFPTRLKPISIKTDIDSDNEFYEMKEINNILDSMLFSIYQPMKYILPNRRKHYEELYDTEVKSGSGRFKQTDREKAVAALMKINMFKRLESSINSFNLTLEKLINRIERTVKLLQSNIDAAFDENYAVLDDMDDDQLEAITVGSDKIQIKLDDIDHIKWLDDLKYDLELLSDLLNQTKKVNVSRDVKFKALKEQIKHKLDNPLNPGNKKVIIFSAFADTVKYLYENLADKLIEAGYHSAMVTGDGSNKTTMKGVKAKELNDVLTNFSPKSKERDKVTENMTEEIDILIATDCISEGQNLQDCDYLINYDIHWNPVRVIQRFGRIDRIGSQNDTIQLVNFWPNMELDEYINLEERVKGRMKILSTSASGEEDIFDTSSKQMNDLEYRKNQLKSLQEEVIDIEDVSGAISITDLTYTDFKSDLTFALKNYEGELRKSPKGMYALVSSSQFEEAVPGVIFCFKQSDEFEMTNNILSPYILLYVNDNGETQIHHTNAKQILDVYRKLSYGNDEPFDKLVKDFNKETNNGKDMSFYTELLRKSIDIVKDKHTDTGFDSFFTPGGTDIQQTLSLDFDDLELISFLIIRGTS